MDRDIGRVAFRGAGPRQNRIPAIRVRLSLHQDSSAADGKITRVFEDAVSPCITRTSREHIAGTYRASVGSRNLARLVWFRVGGLEVGVRMLYRGVRRAACCAAMLSFLFAPRLVWSYLTTGHRFWVFGGIMPLTVVEGEQLVSSGTN